jgi:hypothetical protein
VPAVVPAARVQLAAVGVNVPVEFVVKATEPVGVLGLAEVSVTDAVQLLLVPTLTELGEHVTLVVVACGGAGVAAKTKVPWLDE